MSDLKILDDLDWICNNPTEDEIRYNHECDILSSDDSDENNSSGTLKKYNQLLPRGKAIHKLLHSTRCELSQSWRRIGTESDIPKENLKSKSNLHSNTLHHSTEYESNIYSRRSRSELEYYSQDKDLESESESTSSDEMAKSQKRKRDSSVSNEEESRSLKKIKSKPDEKLISKKVKRKEISHNVSSSESDGFEENSATVQRLKHKGVGVSNRNEVNTHLLSSESDDELNLSQDLSQSDLPLNEAVSENGDVSENYQGSLENTDDETNHVDDSVTATSNSSDIKRKIHRIPKFTDELNEEISKFSLLLNESLSETHDFWILQCPSDMDCSALVNQRLSLGGSCQLSDGERTYEAYSYRNTQTRSADLAVPSQRNLLKLCRIPVSGKIIVEELVEPSTNKGPKDIISEPPSRVEFPDNLRVRHPLLGLDFRKQPRTAKRIESPPKKKKHSKKHGESFNGLAQESQSIPTPSRKKKNKDRSFEDVPVPDHVEELQEETLSDGAVKKKKKKKKHKDNDSFN